MPFDPKKFEKVQEVLGDPDMYPSELLSWMLKKLQDNPYFTISDIQLPVVEGLHLVGGAGEPVFQGAWVKYDTSFDPPGFWKDPWGTVHLQGMLKSGAVGPASNIFVLPTGYRPAFRQLFSVHVTGVAGRVDVAPNGQVSYESATATTYLSIDGLTFRQYT